MRNQEKKVIHRFDQENWEDLVLHSKTPVFVDFLIPERPSFVIGSPDLVRLRQEWEGTAEVGYLDVSLDLSLALKYPVVDLPTLSLFYGGEIVKSFVGPFRFRQNFHELVSRLSSRFPSINSMTWIIGKSAESHKN
jgi:thioredoxin-like negative regulator of GroEL